MSAPHKYDEKLAKRYVANDPAQFVPGYHAMHQMAVQLLAESAPRNAIILVVGAGGGLELEAFARFQPDWHFVGVDPSPPMISEARNRMTDSGYAKRVEWTEGETDDAPEGPFDGATCLLTLHFVPDDGSKLRTLKAIRSRLLAEANFILVDLCLDKNAADYDAARDRYANFALNSGSDRDLVATTRERLQAVLQTVSPERNVELLVEAGFEDIELFYAGHAWRGWAAKAGQGGAS